VAAECIADFLSGACELPVEWPDRLEAVVRESLGFLVAEPALARLLGPEMSGVGAIASSRERLIGVLLERLQQGRELRAAAAPGLPLLTERLLLAGAFGLVAEAVAGGTVEALAELAPQLTQLLLVPYLGRAEAARYGDGPGAPR
jgi:hypothetical protein